MVVRSKQCIICGKAQEMSNFEIRTWDIETGMNTLQVIETCKDCRYNEMNEEEEK